MIKLLISFTLIFLTTSLAQFSTPALDAAKNRVIICSDTTASFEDELDEDHYLLPKQINLTAFHETRIYHSNLRISDKISQLSFNQLSIRAPPFHTLLI